MSFTKKVVAGQTIAAADFAKFFGDHFSEFVKTGFEVSEGTGLVVDISAGTAYVKDASGYMYQIVSDATETLTLTDNATNYVFLHAAATYITDSTTATVPDDAILLATVVCASGDVTSVTDNRNTTPQMPQEFYSELVRSASITSWPGSQTINCGLNLYSNRVLTLKNIRCGIHGDGNYTISYSFDNSSFTTFRTITGKGIATAYYTDTINASAANTSGELYIKFAKSGSGSGATITFYITNILYQSTQ